MVAYSDRRRKERCVEDGEADRRFGADLPIVDLDVSLLDLALDACRFVTCC
jgi:hypothetical protein